MPELPLTLSEHSKSSVTIGRFFRFRVLTTEAPKIRLESFGCSVRSGQADMSRAFAQSGRGGAGNRAAKQPTCPFTANRLRTMQKRGELPGIWSGSRFLVNYPLLMQQLEDLSRKAVRAGEGDDEDGTNT